MSRPQISSAHAHQIAQDLFGLDVPGEVEELPSTADRNFRMGNAVLKAVRAPADDDGWLSCENELLNHLTRARSAGAGHLPPVPELLRTRDDRDLVWVEDAAGKSCGVRALRLLGGTHLRRVSHGPELLHNFGTALGALDRSLLDFAHPAARRADHDWDLLRAAEGINADLDAISDPQRARLVEGLAERFVLDSEPRLDDLRRSVIHGDANDDNVLVDVDDTQVGSAAHGEVFRPTRIAALLDFGDAVHSATVCEPAIALAYLLLDGETVTGTRLARDPLLCIIDPFLRGYAGQHGLTEDECAVLYPLVLQRLCFSVVRSARASRREPDNPYLQVSSEPAWRALEQLQQVDPRRVEWAVRHACGHEAVAGAGRLVAWLGGRRKKPVLGTQLTRGNTRLLDLSLTDVGLAAAGDPAHEPGVTQWAGAVQGIDLSKPATRTRSGRSTRPKVIGWGRWDEPRLVYAGDQFAGDPTSGAAGARRPHADDQRTVHLGVDLFAQAGTSVFAPLDGVVWSVAENNDAFDYGGTVMLEHLIALESDDSNRADEPDEVQSARFFTLYGHLDPQTLDHLEVGQEVAAGAHLGDLGNPSCNGGWTPHLHLQLITDLLDAHDDGVTASGAPRPDNFPGVAPAGERDLWKQVCPDPSVLLFDPPRPPGAVRSNSKSRRPQRRPDFPPAVLDPEPIRRQRDGHLAANLSLSYGSPLLIVRGRGAHLFDQLGRRYVDLVNNVCHVGHAHPHVVRAQHDQATLLNTNTRYLHPNIVDYAERLLMTLPEELEVCWFVNSGSEANDLALRLARHSTGREQVLCLEGAYHGHTEALIEVSPYKHDGRGGRGTPDRVTKVVAPDPYRGHFRGDDTADRYAAEMKAAVRSTRQQGGPAALIVESIQSCGGQIVYPKTYLQQSFAAVRDAGGLCIADEVQVGMGRVGSHFWAFELGDVVPDIVTAGKPIGNGHPLAAVFTTREIADAFCNGMEYFNTFGGNPVSCAIGQAVLDVVERENLQRHAWQLGRHFLDGLRDVQTRHERIGDVRGAGLFLGFELVSDAQERTPDAALASFLVERMRERGYLLSTDGPRNNVIKIKPPLVIEQHDVDSMLSHLEEVLRSVAL